MKTIKLTKRDRALMLEWLTERVDELGPDEAFIEDETPGLMDALRNLLKQLEE